MPNSALPEGLAAYRMYFKRLFNDFDVNVNLFKVGRHKVSGRALLREDMSLEDKEARLEYLSAWWRVHVPHRRSAST